MSRGRNRKKQKEARLVSDQKEAAQKGITVAELRQQRKDKNTAIVVGIASLIPAFRGAKLATKGVTSGYKFLKGLFKSKPKELTKTQVNKIGSAVKKMEKNQPKLKSLKAPKSKSTSLVKPGTAVKPDKTLKQTRKMKKVTGTDRFVGKKELPKKPIKTGSVVPKAAAATTALAVLGSQMKGGKSSIREGEAKADTVKAKRKIDTSDKRFRTGPELQSNRVPDYSPSRGIPKSKVTTKKDGKPVFDKEQAEKRKKLTKDIVRPKGVVKKRRSNIKGSKSYDAQFAYDLAKERGKKEGMSEADAKKFAKGRMSKENYKKVTKLNKGSFIKKSASGHTDFRKGGMFYG